MPETPERPQLNVDGSIDLRPPKTLADALEVFGEAIARFIDAVQTLCEHSIDGDYRSELWHKCLEDRWQEGHLIGASCWLFMPHDERRLEDMGNGLQVSHFPPGFWRDLSDVLMAIEHADPLPPLGTRPMLIRGTAMRRLGRLQAEIRGLVTASRAEALGITSEASASSTSAAKPLTDTELAILRALDGKALSAKELLKAIGTSSTQHLSRAIRTNPVLCELISNKAGRGYFRIDAPPADLTPPPESGLER